MRFGKYLLVTAAVLLSACGAADDQSATAPSSTDTETAGAAQRFATADLIDTTGKSVGSATITATGDSHMLQLNVSGIEAGEHGMHLHAVGSCDTPDFTSAGSHLNPHDKQHGRDNPQGSHLGDLPNITAGADGNATISAPLNAPRAELEQYLFDTDGTAIVVHATADDYRTDPTGNSGGRIACGVLKKS